MIKRFCFPVCECKVNAYFLVFQIFSLFFYFNNLFFVSVTLFYYL